ncbi:MAG: DNA-directed RNA polymerase subunit beta [Chloroflexi bacterium]|nr:DNA-directed RNA polymerase subunit beta [Chloroflexota bacterium]
MVVSTVRPTSQLDAGYKSFNRIPRVVEVPNLIQVQIHSFEWLKKEGLKELFDEISPIEDFSGGRFELRFGAYEIRQPKLTERECRLKETTYSAPMYVTVSLKVKQTGEVKEQTLFMGDVPLMTGNGTFIINGAERVVVSQLVRSPGAYFTVEADPGTGRPLCYAKLIPYRGAWVELETSNKDLLYVKVDRKRRTPVTTLLRALGYADDKIGGLFEDIDNDPDHQFIKTTLARDSAIKTKEEALIEFYRRLRPGEPPSVENANALLQSLFFNARKYDLGRVGRYKLNRSLGVNEQKRTLTEGDIVALIRKMINVNNGREKIDDIDHLGNRRVRAVGELIENQLRVGLLRMERVVRERMTTQMDPATTTPAALINIRPVVAAVREFFGGSQLSQFMDQTNPLAELTHKRRLSALGPGGLSRERAGFDVRDVHHSHYGRICPIETPEGPNIGLLGSLATFARINEYGFIETPYRPVRKEMKSDDPDLAGRAAAEDIADDGGEVLVKEGRVIGRQVAKQIAAFKKARTLKVRPFVSADPNEVSYMPADEEERHIIGQANTELDSKNQMVGARIEVRVGERFAHDFAENVEYLDVSPMQIVSVSTALIPFLEHDDANRALMGSNMQRQAVPLLRPEAPIVGTGMERRVAVDSGQVVVAGDDGVIVSSTGAEIQLQGDGGQVYTYPLTKFVRSNQGTCMSQRPIVGKGQRVIKGQPLADSSSTENGCLALGQNILVGFMSFDGFNYEDAIIVSEALVKDDRFTSIHIEKHEVEARETKLGPEEITRDIPNVGEESLRDLDEEGIIRIGAYVRPGDILVGKITPKGETELTAEEKLLRAIFGEKARDVKDTSLRVPHGQHGKVIDVKVLTKESGDELSPGVLKMVRVWVAHTRKIMEGDKMAGRHGNKGVIARILPVEDMPYLPDGTPLDVILNPIGVPSRMNLGQVLETHLGWAAETLGFKAVSPVFDGARSEAIEDQLARAWFVRESGAIDHRKLDWQTTNGADGIKDTGGYDEEKVAAWLKERGIEADDVFDESKTTVARDACLRLFLKDHAGIDASKMSSEELFEAALNLDRHKHVAVPVFGKSRLFDGRSGETFDQPVTVGMIYMLKLIHLVEDKIHARSTGPYSLITQQPLGGKAQFGGQRFGEMEVWALEAYSAAYNLQEMLTVKSDDVVGRVKTYEACVKGEDIIQPGVPESFHVLLKELQGLGLAVELLNETGDPYVVAPRSEFSPALIADTSDEDIEAAEVDDIEAEAAELEEEPEAAAAPEEEEAEVVGSIAADAVEEEEAEIPEEALFDEENAEESEDEEEPEAEPAEEAPEEAEETLEELDEADDDSESEEDEDEEE